MHAAACAGRLTAGLVFAKALATGAARIEHGALLLVEHRAHVVAAAAIGADFPDFVDLRVAPKFREFPMALGVIYDDPKPTFDADVVAEREKSSGGKVADLGKLLGKGQTWTVE